MHLQWAGSVTRARPRAVSSLPLAPPPGPPSRWRHAWTHDDVGWLDRTIWRPRVGGWGFKHEWVSDYATACFALYFTVYGFAQRMARWTHTLYFSLLLVSFYDFFYFTHFRPHSFLYIWYIYMYIYDSVISTFHLCCPTLLWLFVEAYLLGLHYLNVLRFKIYIIWM